MATPPKPSEVAGEKSLASRIRRNPLQRSQTRRFEATNTLRGKVVLIRGEAGIGKSALIREFLETHGAEAHIYFGSCDDLLTLQPLGPFWDIAQEDSSLSVSLGKGDRRAVMEALLSLMSPDRRATILVVEDVHWADEATYDVVKYLGRRISRSTGLLVLTYRDGELDHEHPLRQVIGGLAPQDLIRIHLCGLSVESVALMVEHIDLDSSEVFSLTDGNPLFVTEVAASGVAWCRRRFRTLFLPGQEGCRQAHDGFWIWCR